MQSSVEYLPELNRVEDGKAPPQRLSDPAKARELGWRLIYGGRLRSEKNAEIQGAFDGNPPFSDAVLIANGCGQQTNVNFLEAAGSLAAAKAPYYELFTGSKTYAQVFTKFGNNANEISELSDGITECMDKTIREDWHEFDFDMQQMINDRTAFGKGFLMRTNPVDYKFRYVPHYNVFAPDASQASVFKLPFLMVRESYQVWELWEKIQNEKSAEKAGWNVEAVKRAVERAYPRRTPRGGSYVSYEEIQRWIKDNQLYQGVVGETVEVFHFLVREYDGKISHYIVDEGRRWQGGGDSDPAAMTEDNFKKHMQFSGEPWLFKAESKFERMTQVIVPFFMQSTTGTWHGANGLGQSIYSQSELSNRMLCSLCDLQMMKNSITLLCKTEGSVQDVNMIQFGTVNIIPPGFEVQQGQFMGDVAGGISMKRQLDEILEMNTGIYRSKMSQPSGNPRTAEEVRMQFQQGAMLSNSSVNCFYLELDPLAFEIFDRMKKDKGFLKRIDEMGIPRQALEQIDCVYWYRTVGNGSPFMRRESIQQLLPMLPMLPEKGRMNLLRDHISAVTHYGMADRYAPQEEEQLNGDDAWCATMESAMLQNGQQPVVTDTQDHVIHTTIHLTAASNALAPLQNAQQPVPGAVQMQVLQFIQAIGPHVAAHLAKVSSDPTRKRDYDALEAQWKKLAQATDQLQRMVEQQAKAQAQQQAKQQQAMMKTQQIQAGQDPATMATMAKTQNDIRMKQAKNQQLMQTKAQKEQQQAIINEEKAKQSMAIADATAAAKIARDHATAKAKAQQPKPQPKK